MLSGMGEASWKKLPSGQRGKPHVPVRLTRLIGLLLHRDAEAD